MLYIHQTSCISPQQTFDNIDIGTLNGSSANKLKAVEPTYHGIPPNILRRMGKAVRMGVGASLPLLKDRALPDGIITGTSNGGMEDCIKFLNQIIEYNEGMLTPGNFVQSTPNAIASQVSMMTQNKSYNITHVHRGLAFENAVLDAVMLSKENPSHTYLLGAVDEISTYNFNIDFLGGWYKKEELSNKDLYQADSPASIAGEGSVMFLVNDKAENATAKLQDIHFFQTTETGKVSAQLKKFLGKSDIGDTSRLLLMTGENGDNRMMRYYDAAELELPSVTVARFKHMSGEYPVASSFAFWLATHILQGQKLPQHAIKKGEANGDFKQILIYNNYKGIQHSFMLLASGSE